MTRPWWYEASWFCVGAILAVGLLAGVALALTGAYT